MDEGDLQLRNATYRLFVELGRAPTADEAGREIGPGADAVRVGWRRQHDVHALVLDDATGEIRMASPFSAVPTPFRVHAAAGRGDPRAPGAHEPVLAPPVGGVGVRATAPRAD